jgi:peptide methionine sulfoxide reductase MsrA
MDTKEISKIKIILIRYNNLKTLYNNNNSHKPYTKSNKSSDKCMNNNRASKDKFKM